jgi:hypothetical protein
MENSFVSSVSARVRVSIDDSVSGTGFRVHASDSLPRGANDWMTGRNVTSSLGLRLVRDSLQPTRFIDGFVSLPLFKSMERIAPTRERSRVNATASLVSDARN